MQWELILKFFIISSSPLGILVTQTRVNYIRGHLIYPKTGILLIRRIAVIVLNEFQYGGLSKLSNE